MTTRPDRIHLRDHVVDIEIGAFAGERGRRQRLRAGIDVDLAAPVTDAGDDVDRVLSYDVLVEAVADALATRRYDLLEALAEDVAARVLAHPAAATVRVTMEKLDLVPGALGVSIERHRSAVSAQPERDLSLPQILVAPDGAPQGAAVLVPVAPDLPLPDQGDRAQLQMLALDQGAWALAARLGLEVVDSRTEIDAATQSGRAVVWAPTRMLRAAVDPDLSILSDPARLADWLGQELARR